MRVRVIVPPAPIVTLEETKRHLRVDAGNTDDDTLIDGMIDAACQHIDGPQGWLGRALGVQVLEARLDGFPRGAIKLLCPPVLEVVSVGYLDAAGAAQAVPADVYEARGDEFSVAWGKSWPSPRAQAEAVRVQYRAGFGKLDTAVPPVWANDVPAPIRAAVLLHVGALYTNREAAGQQQVGLPGGYYDLLSPFRIWSI